ncbi:MAG: DegT/DnrJ/EryC1/StrS family aminotransferase [Candidatus Acetothermia bacterium]
MKVPLLDLTRQYRDIKDEVDEGIQEVVDSQYFILGPEVEKFEEEVAGYCGVKHAVGVASGTDAIKLALQAVGVGEGENDKVVTSPFTYFATAGSIVNAGAEPVFVDIKPDTYNVDPEKIRELLEGSDNPQDYKAIVPVHLYGQTADMDEITEIADEYDTAVIEDAAQAIGAEFQGEKAGSIGDVGCFSFFPTKNLGGYGDGGMVTTNDDELAEKVNMLRVHGSKKKYFNELIGHNSRLDALQAAVLSAKLPHLDGWSEERRENARKYDAYLKDVPGVTTPTVLDNRNHIYHQYTIRVGEGKRDGLQDYLNENDVGNKIYYPLSLHQQGCFEHLGYGEGDLPVSERASREVISLPVFPELTDEEIEYVCETVGEYVS